MSGLEFETVDVKFTHGQDQRTQRKLVQGKWDTLLNYSLSKDNTPVRRDGAQVLLAANANGLISHNDELCTILSGSMATVSATGTPVAKTVPGEVPYVDLAKTEIDSTPGYHDAPDVAYGSGFACYVWRDRNESGTLVGIRCSLVDVSSGAKLVNAALIASGTTFVSPRVNATSTAFHMFFIDTSGTPTLYGVVIEFSAPTTVGTPAPLVASANLSGKNFDVCRYLSASLIAYVWTDGVTSLRILQVTNTGTVPSILQGPTNAISEANVNNAAIQAVAVAPFIGEAHAGAYVVTTAGGAIAGGCVGVVNDGFLAVTAGPTNIDASIPPVAGACHVTAVSDSSTHMMVFTDQYSSYGSVDFRPLRDISTTTALAATPLTLLSSACFDSNIARAQGHQGPWIAGKAFLVGSAMFLPVQVLENYQGGAVPTSAASGCANNNEQCSWYLLDVSNAVLGAAPAFTVVSSALYGTLGFNFTISANIAPPCQTPCSVAGPTTSAGYIVGVQEKARLQLVNTFGFFTAGNLSSLTLTPRVSNGAVSAQLGESTFIAGGQLGDYDGKQVIQHGFPMFPEGARATNVASGAGLGLTVGVHQLVFVYEWTDGAGNRTQSRPTVPISVTVLNTTDQIDCIVPATQLPQNAGYNSSVSTLTVVAYMTVASGLAFFRVIESLTTVNTNTTAASVVTFSIGLLGAADNVISANELLYTQPTLGTASLSNNPPGPVSALCVGRNRLWYLKADQPFQWGFSQALSPNTSLQFNSSLGGFLPQDSGGAVAVAMLDEKTIFFGKRRIYFVTGNLPDSGGNNNGLSDPLDIQSDVGCSDARSVLGEMPDGILFKSQQGWHMLGRDLSVRYVGAGVSQFDSQTVTSAVLMQDRKEARFTMSAGVTLVYSTLLNEWSYFIYGASTTSGYVVADAAWWPSLSRYVWCSINDGSNSDKPGAFSDQVGAHAAENFTTLARTAWLKIGALEGFQRVRKVLVTNSTTANPGTLNSTLFLAVYFDDSYTNAINYLVTFQSATIASNTDPFPQTSQSVDYRHIIEKLQKCKSIAFEFGETANSTTASTLTGIQAIALEIGRKPGVRRLGSGQTVGT